MKNKIKMYEEKKKKTIRNNVQDTQMHSTVHHRKEVTTVTEVNSRHEEAYEEVHTCINEATAIVAEEEIFIKHTKEDAAKATGINKNIEKTRALERIEITKTPVIVVVRIVQR